jgi:ribonuclease-3
MNDPSLGELSTDNPQVFAQRIGLQFQNYSLLNRALTHRSYLNEHPDALEDNERLEFLGDAVLDFIVGAWLYNQFPEMAEGDLTRLRSALVRTEQLAEFGNGIEIGSFLRLGKGEAASGGRMRQAILCGAFEALVGAIYIDTGLSSVKRFIEPRLENAVKTILKNRQHRDSKSMLQEWSQAQGFEPPLYKMISMDGPEHNKTYDIEVLIDGKSLGVGTGRSKQAAAKAAARNALNLLGLD